MLRKKEGMKGEQAVPRGLQALSHLRNGTHLGEPAETDPGRKASASN